MSSTQVEEGGGPPSFELEEELPEDPETDLEPQMVTHQSEVHCTSASVPARELGAGHKEVRTAGGGKNKNATANSTANSELGMSMSIEVHFCDGCGFIGNENK